VNIVLLGSVNPLDFELSEKDFDQVQTFNFRRSVPVSDLAKSLVELGHSVTVIGSARIEEGILRLTTLDGVKLIFVQGRRQEKLKAITFYSSERKSMLTHIRTVKPDVLHAHWTYEYALTAQDSGLPHVITVHDEPWQILGGFRNFYFLLRLLNAIKVRWRKSENMVYVSEYIRDLWNKRMFSTGGLVIPNMNRLVKSNAIETGHSNNVITVANADRRKNIRGLLAAWEMATLVNPNLRLHLVGPGLGMTDPLAQHFEGRFKGDQVTWHGPISRRELSNLYSSCHVLVHPSQSESFGLIYLEAFAFKLGIVSLAKSGSASEIVGDAGLILDDDSPEELANAILKLTSSHILHTKLTERGSLRLELYSPSRIARMYISLYQRISKESK
jgi:glycosyltransferase involved in cell wall biosynthesis